MCLAFPHSKFLALEQSLEVEDLQVQLDEKMFHEMVDGGSDANNGVKIFRITMNEDDWDRLYIIALSMITTHDCKSIPIVV